jgi:hypothetical protein
MGTSASSESELSSCACSPLPSFVCFFERLGFLPSDAGLHARVYRAPLTLDLLCTDTFGDFQLWVRDHFTPTLVGIDSTNLWMRTHVQAPMYAFMIDEFLDTQEGSSCKHMAFGYVPQL